MACVESAFVGVIITVYCLLKRPESAILELKADMCRPSRGPGAEDQPAASAVNRSIIDMTPGDLSLY